MVYNITGIISMANSTIQETLVMRTPAIELVEMLAREINRTSLPAAEVATIATAVANSSIIAQQTLQIAQNARYINF